MIRKGWLADVVDAQPAAKAAFVRRSAPDAPETADFSRNGVPPWRIAPVASSVES